MNRFYVMLGVVALVLAVTVFALLRTGEAGASAAAAGPPPTVADDGFRGYTLGQDGAPVEITEYVDFECPVCASFATIQMPTIKDQLINTGKVRWRFRDFPLPIHKYSRFAAHAAQCAGAQGKYFEMQDQLFTHHQWAQTGKDPSSLFRSFAQTAGLDLKGYDACMQDGTFAQRIEYSRQEGESQRVDGTPTFFVNGKKMDFRRLPGSDDFKGIVDSVIAHTPAPQRTGRGHGTAHDAIKR
jgi:protein-disulfide isomerase